LKEYDGATMQYIGIMPTNVSLEKYIDEVKASDIDILINNLKSIELNNFKDGVITEVSGNIPLFNFEYEINLVNELKKFGITDVFGSKADLSNLTSSKASISKAVHKANIEFSNEGIKAAAVTAMGGEGAAGPDFDYLYDVPVEKIDLTFNKPFVFLIRDKESGEVWFAGSVSKPTQIELEDLGGA
jgi:serpin B